MIIAIKKPEEISEIRAAGKILARVLEELTAQAKAGVTLLELDKLANQLIRTSGGSPVFLGYQPMGASRPFPATLCTSVNEVVVHGVPTQRRLQEGDILKIDLGVRSRGYIADAAITIGIGNIAPQAAMLMKVTQEALAAGIRACRAGSRLGDIGAAIQETVERGGFSVVEGLTGHGVGKELHEDPEVPNKGTRGTGLVLRSGMVLALEPMVSAGSPHILQESDESYRTRDKSLAAHFEHTVLVTRNDAEILTLR
jgi:methionyl aminopeptidase